MADGTAIEWTHRAGTKGETWNPIRARNKASGKVGHFCVKVSAGCANCYAERLQMPLFGNDVRYAAQDLARVDVYVDEKMLTQPLRWAAPRTVFVCSMTDLFGDWVTDTMLDNIFAVMTAAPQHTFQVLTKRPKRMRDYLSDPRTSGRIAEQIVEASWAKLVSAKDQETADSRIPSLLATPAAIRFLSVEPLLGAVDLTGALPQVHHHPDNNLSSPATRLAIGQIIKAAAKKLGGAPTVDWVIGGGESGPKARPTHPAWGKALQAQCAYAGVPFFWKQNGEWAPVSELGETDDLYYPAPSPRDPEVGRRCRVGTMVMDADGTTHDFLAPTAFRGAGAMMMMRAGKKRTGRTLGGQLYSEFPETKP